jgi:hypothetical protein
MAKYNKGANMTTITDQEQQIFDYVHAMLGGSMVDVELDPIHYKIGLERALNRFRQKSPNSVEESYIFIDLVKDQNEYILPQEVITVRQLFRRSVGSRTGGGDGGSLFEPFNLAYTNTYLLAGSRMGGLATYDFFSQHQEMVGRMFGSFIEFKWNSVNKKLTILQRPRAEEGVMVWVYNHRPDFQLYEDFQAKQWLRDYTLASCKLMLGEAREKFQTLPGPQGGSSLNGTQLKSEAVAAMEALDKELELSVAGGQGLSFVIG